MLLFLVFIYFIFVLCVRLFSVPRSFLLFFFAFSRDVPVTLFAFCAFCLHAGPLYARLQLSISCKGLVNLDKLSKSDPFVVRVIKDTRDEHRELSISLSQQDVSTFMNTLIILGTVLYSSSIIIVYE